MFISKRNNIVYPQSEHVKLAAVIADHWGNDEFSKPPVPFDSFVKAVANHDNGYGHYDASAIGQQTEEGILKLWQRCTEQALGDPYAEIIIKRHFMRLTSMYSDFPRLAAFHGKLENELAGLYKQHEFDPFHFDVTDTVMHVCDAIAFSFCQEEMATRELKVYTDENEESTVTMSYSIDENHSICIDPYPLDESLITGVITAYDKTDYPKVLLPNEVNYQIMNKS